MAEEVLPLALMTQEQTNWCWAAAASGVAALFHGGSHPAQCAVAAVVLKDPDCCAHPQSGNVAAELDHAMHAVNVPAILKPVSDLSFSLVTTQILKRRTPIGARISGKTIPLAHFVLIIGCNPDTDEVVCADPWGAVGTPAPRYRMPFVKMKHDYGGWGRVTDICLLS